jgi:cytochrome c-type biogenesis protein CcmH/NrfF
MRLSFKKWAIWMKAVQAAALVVALCFTLGATSGKERFDRLSHRMTCPCSCTELLGECNHVGCPDSGPMTNELMASIKNGQTDKQILDAFTAEYGTTVLAAPTTQGFDLVAWIAPAAVFLAALFGVILVARHWAATRPQAAAVQNDSPEMSAIREKIRRETGADGGFDR